ncbi:MAG: hypothetical protein ACRDZ6_07065 [Acidimicrobiales bacterium]
MRFKLGFVIGCAAGAWAAGKAVKLQRTAVPSASKPRGNGSADITAEKVRAIGDLARERFGTFLDSPAGNAAMKRFTDLVGESLTGIVTSRPVSTTARSR